MSKKLAFCRSHCTRKLGWNDKRRLECQQRSSCVAFDRFVQDGMPPANDLNDALETFAMDLIDWIFIHHEHLDTSDDESCLFSDRPFVDSLDLENWVKQRFPELKDYYYTKERPSHGQNEGA